MERDFAVSGTDGRFVVRYGGLNDWHVCRDGLRDENLTNIMKNNCTVGAFAHNATPIANALRKQYESEKPKKFETTAGTWDIYHTAIGDTTNDFAKFLASNIGALTKTPNFKVTLEEIK